MGFVITKKLCNSGFDVLPDIRPGANKSRLRDSIVAGVLEVEAGMWSEIVSEHSPNVAICAHWDGILKQDRENVELQSTTVESIMNMAIATKESGTEKFLCFGSQAEAKGSIDLIMEEFYDPGRSAYGIPKPSCINIYFFI